MGCRMDRLGCRDNLDIGIWSVVLDSRTTDYLLMTGFEGYTQLLAVN